MPRFLLGLVLAVMSAAAVSHFGGDPALSVFVAAMVAIGVWFRGFELLGDLLWSGLCWMASAVWH